VAKLYANGDGDDTDTTSDTDTASDTDSDNDDAPPWVKKTAKKKVAKAAKQAVKRPGKSRKMASDDSSSSDDDSRTPGSIQGATVEPFATPRAIAAGGDTNPGQVEDIRVCIGYEFSKIQPPTPSKSQRLTAAERTARREEGMLRVNSCNNHLATILSAATRQTCLLNYADICAHLLGRVEGSTRVFAHRVYSTRSVVKIDTMVWQARQRAQSLLDDGNLIMDKSTRVVTTHMHSDVGYQWIMRQYFVYEPPKTVWVRQNGMCAYCDVFTTPPDGEGVGMCCRDVMNAEVAVSERTQLLRMKQEANTELGRLLFDRILHPDKSVFVCAGCAQAHESITGGIRTRFSHSDLVPFPSSIDNEHLFRYFTACSGLLSVFSIFVCEIDLHCERDAVVLLDDEVGAQDDEVNITMMAYVTNIRDSELVYIKIPLSIFCLRSKKRFRSGFTVCNPNFASTDIPCLAETAASATDTYITSRCHIFSCIYRRRVLTYVNCVGESDDTNPFAGRLFVFLCQSLFARRTDTPHADPEARLWKLLGERIHGEFRSRTVLDADSHYFDSDETSQTTFCEQSVLLACRRKRLSNVGVAQVPEHSMSRMAIEHYSTVHIIESIVLLYNFFPDSLLTLQQNRNHYHLYRLVAVHEIASRQSHWLNTENWKHVPNMPVCDPTAAVWQSTTGTADRMRFDHTELCNFIDMRANAQRWLPEISAIGQARFVCFYQRLTPNRGLHQNATPITMSSPLARNRSALLRTLFGQDPAESPTMHMAKKAARAVLELPNQVFHTATQEYTRMMAMAVRLLGYVILHELCSILQQRNVDPREFHLFLYLFWNKFVILEGFHKGSESVCTGMLVGQPAVDFGNIDLHAVLTRFRGFLAAQCQSLQSTRNKDLRPVFANVKTLLARFGVLLSSRHKCTSTANAIRCLATFELRLAQDTDEEIYALGNTKLMLHYLSRALEFAAMQQYLSDIRDTLV